MNGQFDCSQEAAGYARAFAKGASVLPFAEAQLGAQVMRRAHFRMRASVRAAEDIRDAEIADFDLRSEPLHRKSRRDATVDASESDTQLRTPAADARIEICSAASHRGG